jgi:hypothetical protein
MRWVMNGWDGIGSVGCGMGWVRWDRMNDEGRRVVWLGRMGDGEKSKCKGGWGGKGSSGG